MRYLMFFVCFEIILLISLNGNAQIGYISKESTFKIKDKPIEGVKYYLFMKNSLYLLPFQNGVISIPDTLSSKLIDLIVSYKKHSFFVTNFNYSESYYLHTYFDARFFNNGVNKKYGGYSKLKFLFKKRYLIDDGSGYVTITPWVDISKYNLANTN